MYKKTQLKCDMFGVGSAVSGGLQAAGNVWAAKETASATRDAAQKSYEGQIAANDANIQIANSTNQANIQMQRETNQANLNLARQQNLWNIDQWNRQNAYNSPANQMKLYKDAGLNPNLLQGSFSPAESLQSADLANQQAPKATAVPFIQNAYGDAAKIQTSGTATAMSYLKDAVKDAASVSKILSEKKNLDIDAEYKPKLNDAELKKAMRQITYMDKVNNWFDKEHAAQLDETLEKVNLLRQQAKLTESQKERNDIQKSLDAFDLEFKNHAKEWIFKMPEQEYKNLRQQFNVMSAQIKKIQTEVDLLDVDRQQKEELLNYVRQHPDMFFGKNLDPGNRLLNYCIDWFFENPSKADKELESMFSFRPKNSNYKQNDYDYQSDNATGMER